MGRIPKVTPGGTGGRSASRRWTDRARTASGTEESERSFHGPHLPATGCDGQHRISDFNSPLIDS